MESDNFLRSHFILHCVMFVVPDDDSRLLKHVDHYTNRYPMGTCVCCKGMQYVYRSTIKMLCSFPKVFLRKFHAAKMMSNPFKTHEMSLASLRELEARKIKKNYVIISQCHDFIAGL